jgi:predicted amidohydrolase
MIKVAAVQHDIVWESPGETFAHVEPMIAVAASAGARLVLLTEMFATGFSMDTDRIAERPNGAGASFLIGQAAKHDVWIGASVPVRSGDSGAALPTNQFVLAGPDGTVHRYDKIHPFSYAGEHERYAAGDKVISVTIDGVRVTPFVCYDLRFGDWFWNAAESTDLYVIVANWPASRREHWKTLLQARAIENQAYVVGVNRVGTGGGVGYAGDSSIVSPLGEVLAAASNIETVLVADVDPATVDNVRSKFPFLRDR